MRNIKEIGRVVAVAGMLASTFSGCGTRVLDVQLEDLSKDPCAFEGQVVSTTGFARDISEKLISEEIFTKSGLCADLNTAKNIFSMDAEYEKCLEKIMIVNEKIKTDFKLQPEPQNKQPFTRTSYVFTIFGSSIVNYESARNEYKEIFESKIKVNGKIINQKGACLLYAKKITKAE